jgi:hypothetical protein
MLLLLSLVDNSILRPNLTLASTDFLVIYCFTSRSRIFTYEYGDVTITGEGLQNLGLCSVLRAFEQGGVSCCDTGPQFFWSHPKVRPIQSPCTTHKEVWRIYSNPDSHGLQLKKIFYFMEVYNQRDYDRGIGEDRNDNSG